MVHPSYRALSILLRTSKESSRADEVALFAGTGVPSGATVTGGQTLESAQAALYFREDGSNANEVLYATLNGGTAWTALELGPAVHADPGDAGAIPVTSSGVCALTSAGASETRTLAIPTFAGQRLSLVHTADGGDIAITAAAAINQAGDTGIAMAEVGDFLELVGVDIGGALRWRVVSNDGCVLS